MFHLGFFLRTFIGIGPLVEYRSTGYDTLHKLYNKYITFLIIIIQSNQKWRVAMYVHKNGA